MFLTNAVPVADLLPTTCDPDHERILKGERAREWLVDFQWAAIDQFETILVSCLWAVSEPILSTVLTRSIRCPEIRVTQSQSMRRDSCFRRIRMKRHASPVPKHYG